MHEAYMMTIGKRPLDRVLRAFLQKRHYIALKNMLLLYPRPFHNLRRYLGNQGSYPYQVSIRTPAGTVKPNLYSYHDLQTVNEIFCRLDYLADLATQVVLDIGSNIGISALYFLTRNPSCKAFLYEPLPFNLHRLKANLQGFEKRYHIQPVAVADFNGNAHFTIEDSGRYGGIADKSTPQTIEVPCLHINQVLESVLTHEDKIDILKIDIEGYEMNVLKSIEPKYFKKIRSIYVETDTQSPLELSGFNAHRYGDIHCYHSILQVS